LTGRLVTEEHIEHGPVTLATYLTYFRAAGGLLLCIIVLMSFAFPVACSAFTDWWLSRWVVFVRSASNILSVCLSLCLSRKSK